MLELPFGLRGVRLMHVSEVAAGRACNCVCPACHQPLIARKGAHNTHHFAHAGGAECAHGLETALHLAAKQMLESEGIIRLPAVILAFDYSHKPPWQIQPETLVRFERVQLENRLGAIVPDILVHVKDRPLLIEIAVTHAVDAAKLARIRRLGISALEITLRDFEREPTLPALRQELLFGTGSKRWLYNARAEAVRQQVFALSEAKALRSDGLTVYVEDCPLGARRIGGKPAANVVADCLPCPYCVRAGADGHLLCTGGRRIGAYQDLIGLMDSPLFS
ncbi:MAG: hypothetical protein E6J26_08770 [Chloroflexi bacterium]|nr:MAG: hypothetical protein E6J26_08770 [Chloroflexota bacterium]